MASERRVYVMVFNYEPGPSFYGSTFYGQLVLNNLFDWMGDFSAYRDLRYDPPPKGRDTAYWSWKPAASTDSYWRSLQGGWLASDKKLGGKVCLYDKITNGLVLVIDGVLKSGDSYRNFNGSFTGARKSDKSAAAPMEDITLCCMCF
jgi:hypothetical protein